MAVVSGNLELKDIFEKERFPKSNWQFISLVVYFPFGLILAILRFFIGFHACLVGLVLTHTPFIRSVVLRLFCLVLGINVEQENKHERDKSARVIVANCVTRFDFIAFHLTTDCLTHAVWRTRLPIVLVPGLHDFSAEGNILESMKTHVGSSEVPLLFQPEDTTSAKSCLLKFSSTPAKISRRVQPVALTVERPLWANTAPTVLGTTLSADLFWFLFSPYTVFKLRYLRVLTQKKEESEEDFAVRLQSVIAERLSLQVSSFTASDKAEYEKRWLEERDRYSSVHQHQHQTTGLYRPQQRQLQVSAELLRMSAQVSEVLPRVPTDVILRDLGRTRSVDVTIANILEGVVRYSPISEELAGPSPFSGRRRSGEDTTVKQRTGESSASSASALERIASFKERKAAMIAEARRKYIEKHRLDLSPPPPPL